MLPGPAVAAALLANGVTHVVWVPDSELGTWDAAFSSSPHLTLVRVCREGEAFAVAAGLVIGGKRPIVVVQCTGLFEAGDALRNAVHDLGLPLLVLVGVRSLKASRAGTTSDNCPRFTRPVLDAWGLSVTPLEDHHTAAEFTRMLADAVATARPHVFLLAE